MDIRIKVEFGSPFQRQVNESMFKALLTALKTQIEGSHRKNKMVLMIDYDEIEIAKKI